MLSKNSKNRRAYSREQLREPAFLSPGLRGWRPDAAFGRGAFGSGAVAKDSEIRENPKTEMPDSVTKLRFNRNLATFTEIRKSS